MVRVTLDVVSTLSEGFLFAFSNEASTSDSTYAPNAGNDATHSSLVEVVDDGGARGIAAFFDCA